MHSATLPKPTDASLYQPLNLDDTDSSVVRVNKPFPGDLATRVPAHGRVITAAEEVQAQPRPGSGGATASAVHNVPQDELPADWHMRGAGQPRHRGADRGSRAAP